MHIDAADGSEDVAEAVRATAADTEDAIRDMQEDEAVTRRALDLLNSRRKDPYEAATAALREDTQQWWADTLARDLGACPSSRGILGTNLIPFGA